MQNSHSINSDKLSIINYSTFTKMQQNSSLTPARKIRNLKYKKKHQKSENNFDLLAWVAASSRRAHHKKGATLIRKARVVKKTGKTREARVKKLTSLKKTILRNRELRHDHTLSPHKEHTNEALLENSLFQESFHDVDSMNICQEKLKDGTLTGLDASMQQLNISPKAYQNQLDLVHSLDCVNPAETSTQQKHGAITDEINEMSIRNSFPKPFKSLHSRRFREYCDNCTTSDLAQFSKQLLSDLNRFQKRAFQKNPIKANAHRRFVLGFREVQNSLRINKIKLVLMATDCERCNLEGGIDNMIESIKAECKTFEVPYAFPLQRRQLAYALNKNGNISCVGILDYDGARDIFSQLLRSLESARMKYAVAVESTQEKIV